MSEEVIINGVDEAPSSEAAEATLDNALASLKTGKTPDPIFEPEVENEDKVETEESPKRETLKLSDKSKERFVETDQPEVQKRIDQLYRNEKIANERNLLLQDELRKLADAAEQREVFLMTKLQEIQNKDTARDNAATLSDLRKQYNEAIQNLEYDQASKINEKILDFKVEEKLNSRLDQKTPVENNQRQVKQPAVFSPENPVDVAELNILTSQRGEDGNPAKPWLYGNHPRFQEFVNKAAEVSQTYLARGIRPTLSTIINEAEKSLGLVGNQKGSSNQGQAPSSLKHAPVLSSNTTLNAGSSDNQANKISDLERSYAAKLGVSEKDYMRLRKFSSSGPISMDNFKK